MLKGRELGRDGFYYFSNTDPPKIEKGEGDNGIPLPYSLNEWAEFFHMNRLTGWGDFLIFIPKPSRGADSGKCRVAKLWGIKVPHNIRLYNNYEIL